MVDVVSIVVAVVSLVGSLVAAAFTGWVSFYIDSVKRRNEAKRLTNKYRDPLTLSAYELQSRLFGLVQTKLLTHIEDPQRRPLIVEYTCYLIGQYFSWVFIFRRQAQFLRFSTDPTNKALMKIMDSIAMEFSRELAGENVFMLWRGQQMAIGEIITNKEGGEMYCMGFAEFSAKYKDDAVFKGWFSSVGESVDALAKAKREGTLEVDHRLRRLQHLLVDLVMLLDPDKIKSSGFAQAKVERADVCDCQDCHGRQDSVGSTVDTKTSARRRAPQDGGEKV